MRACLHQLRNTACFCACELEWEVWTVFTLHNRPLELEKPWGCSSSGFINKETEATRKRKAAKLPISTVYLARLIGWPFGGKGH